MRQGLIGLCIAMLGMQVSAQEISPEADQAMWCATAITLLDTLGVYPPEAPNAVALSRVWSQQAFTAFDAAGLSDETVQGLIQSYAEELGMQLPDYLASSDPEALRLDINACLEI